MCNDTKEKLDVEFCKNFSATVEEGHFYPSIRITTNTRIIKRFFNGLFEYKTEDEVQKILKSNKIVFLSDIAFTKLRYICIYKDGINSISSIKRAIGGIYVEYYSGSFWITSFKGYRQQVKIGKLLKAITNLNDTEISNCVDKFNRYHDYDLSCIQISDNISDVYNYSHDSSGTVGGSCMKGCGEYFESLENSCPTLKIAYIKDYKNDYYLCGRALLWEAYDSEGNLYKIMDRIYYDCEKTKILLEKYAEANGYYFRKESSGYCTSFYDTSNKKWVELKLKVELKNSLIGTYTPYMDTFRYYNKNNNTLYNFDGAGYTDALTDTEGAAVYTTCGVCGESCDDDSVFSDYHGEIICESCLEDYRYVESRDDYIYYDFVIQLRDTDTYFLQDDSDDLVWVGDRGWYDYADNVHFVVDTEEYYEDIDELYYTEDTCDWYSSNLDLYEYDGVYYSERQEDLEQQEEEV